MLYKNNDYRWKIAGQYYNLARFYSKKGFADKAFIMLKRASDTGYNNFSCVYFHPDFLAVRKLKFWRTFINIGKPPINCSSIGYYINKNGEKTLLYSNTLKILLSNRIKNHLWLYRKYISKIIIKEYTFAGKPRFKVYFKSIKSSEAFEYFKIKEYSLSGELIYEYFKKNRLSIYYFYYKNKVWGVNYKENKGNIKWQLAAS